MSIVVTSRITWREAWHKHSSLTASSGPPLCGGRHDAVVTAVRSRAGGDTCCFLCLWDVNFMFTLKGRGNVVLSVFGGWVSWFELGFRAHPPGLSFPWAGEMAAPILAQGRCGCACPGAAVMRAARWGAYNGRSCLSRGREARHLRSGCLRRLWRRILPGLCSSSGAGVSWLILCDPSLCFCLHMALSLCVSYKDNCLWIEGPPGKRRMISSF